MFAVIREVLDFLFKAAARYVTTPEGSKEWQDIRDAAGGVRKASQNDLSSIRPEADNPNRNVGSVPGRVPASSEGGGDESIPAPRQRGGKRV